MNGPAGKVHVGQGAVAIERNEVDAAPTGAIGVGHADDGLGHPSRHRIGQHIRSPDPRFTLASPRVKKRASIVSQVQVVAGFLGHAGRLLPRARRRHSPDLERIRPGKIDPFSIGRRHGAAHGLAHQRLRLGRRRSHHILILLAVLDDRERNSPIGEPTRIGDLDRLETGPLNRVCAVAAGHPYFLVPGAARDEGEALAVRGPNWP